MYCSLGFLSPWFPLFFLFICVPFHFCFISYPVNSFSYSFFRCSVFLPPFISLYLTPWFYSFCLYVSTFLSFCYSLVMFFPFSFFFILRVSYFFFLFSFFLFVLVQFALVFTWRALLSHHLSPLCTGGLITVFLFVNWTSQAVGVGVYVCVCVCMCVCVYMCGCVCTVLLTCAINWFGLPLSLMTPRSLGFTTIHQ